MIRNGPTFPCLFLLLSIFHQFHWFEPDAWFKRDKIWFDISTMTGLRPGGSGFRIPAGKKVLSSPKRPYQTHGPSCLLGSLSYPPEVKGLGSGCDHSLPASAEVKKG